MSIKELNEYCKQHNKMIVFGRTYFGTPVLAGLKNNCMEVQKK